MSQVLSDDVLESIQKACNGQIRTPVEIVNDALGDCVSSDIPAVDYAFAIRELVVEAQQAIQEQLDNTERELSAILKQIEEGPSLEETTQQTTDALRTLRSAVAEVGDGAKAAVLDVDSFCTELRELDQAKYEMMRAITLISNISAVQTQLERIESCIGNNEFAGIANELEGCCSLLDGLKRTCPQLERVEKLREYYDSICRKLASVANQNLSEFNIMMTPEKCAKILAAVDVLGEQDREQFISGLIEKEMRNYRGRFDTSSSKALSSVDDRCKWFTSLLDEFKTRYSDAPRRWYLCQRLINEWQDRTIDVLQPKVEEAVAEYNSTKSGDQRKKLVSLLQPIYVMHALELALQRDYGTKDDEFLDDNEPAWRFDNRVTRAFQPIMPLFVDYERTKLLEVVASVNAKDYQDAVERFRPVTHSTMLSPFDPVAIDNSTTSTAVLPSAENLLAHLRSSVQSCLNYSNQSVLKDLHKVHQEVISAYVKALAQKHIALSVPDNRSGFWPGGGELADSISPIRPFSTVVGPIPPLTNRVATPQAEIEVVVSASTAAFLLSQLHSLGEQTRDAISPEFKEAISFSSIMNTLKGLIHACLDAAGVCFSNRLTHLLMPAITQKGGKGASPENAFRNAEQEMRSLVEGVSSFVPAVPEEYRGPLVARLGSATAQSITEAAIRGGASNREMIQNIQNLASNMKTEARAIPANVAQSLQLQGDLLPSDQQSHYEEIIAFSFTEVQDILETMKASKSAQEIGEKVRDRLSAEGEVPESYITFVIGRLSSAMQLSRGETRLPLDITFGAADDLSMSEAPSRFNFDFIRNFAGRTKR